MVLEEILMVVCKLPILLAERKMRVADLIRGTGINKTTLHKLYNGDLTRIDLDTINRICDYLDIQVGDLFVFEKDIIELELSFAIHLQYHCLFIYYHNNSI